MVWRARFTNLPAADYALGRGVFRVVALGLFSAGAGFTGNTGLRNLRPGFPPLCGHLVLGKNPSSHCFDGWLLDRSAAPAGHSHPHLVVSTVFFGPGDVRPGFLSDRDHPALSPCLHLFLSGHLATFSACWFSFHVRPAVDSSLPSQFPDWFWSTSAPAST